MNKSPVKNNMKLFKLLPFAKSSIVIAVGLLAHSYSYSQPVTEFGSIIIEDKALKAKEFESVKSSPVQSTLDVSRPVVEIPKDFFENNIYPTASFATAASSIAPSMVSIPFNGPGGFDERIAIRGFADANDTFTLQFDGIPFSDTNDPSHHSQVFFPAPFIGGMVVDRSPGGASTLGTANYGGVIGILSKPLENTRSGSVYGNYGSFNTTLIGAEYQSGISENSEHNTKFTFNAHEAKTDGYLSNSWMKRDAGSFKLESELTKDTKFTIFLSALIWHSNSTDNPSQLAVNALSSPANSSYSSYYKGDNYFQSLDPTRKDNANYNMQDINTTFNYLGINSNLGSGWKLDDKLYYMSYNNQEKYTKNTDAATTGLYSGSTSGGVDKLNSYQTFGNITRLTLDTDSGQLRTGLWLQHSSTRRHQFAMDVGSNTYADPSLTASTIVNQQFFQNTIQPYVEFEFKVNDKLRITPGFKYNIYSIDMNNFPSSKVCTSTNISGCSSQYNSSATYNDPLPFLEARYFIEKNWNVYGQYAKGDVIPSSSVLDVTKTVNVPPAPVRTNTVQFGTVYQTPAFMFDFDVYYTTADSSYAKVVDGNGGYTYTPSDAVIYKGIEAQANYVLGGGFNLYGNASLLRANYDNAAGLSAASVPNDIETLALMYKKNEINASILVKRVGPQWVDSSDASIHQFYQLDPIYLTSLQFNYTMNNVAPYIKSLRLRAGIDNLFDKRYIFAYTPGSSVAGSAPGTTTTDTVQLNSGRAIFAGLEARF